MCAKENEKRKKERKAKVMPNTIGKRACLSACVCVVRKKMRNKKMSEISKAQIHTHTHTPLAPQRMKTHNQDNDNALLMSVVWCAEKEKDCNGVSVNVE